MTNLKMLQARLVVAGADSAIDFYQRAFGATLRNRYTGPDGRIVLRSWCSAVPPSRSRTRTAWTERPPRSVVPV